MKTFLKDFFVNPKTIAGIFFAFIALFFLFLTIDPALIALKDAFLLTVGCTVIVFYGKFIREYKNE